MEDPYLRGIFDGRTHPFDPNLQVHPQAPEKRVYEDFGPGVLEALSRQLAAAGNIDPNAQQVEDQRAYLDNIYNDTVSTYVPVPVTQVLADFAKNKYQQHNQDTGSVFLNSLLGYIPNSNAAPGGGGNPGSGNNSGGGSGGSGGSGGGSPATPTQVADEYLARMKGNGGLMDARGYGGLGMEGYTLGGAGNPFGAGAVTGYSGRDGGGGGGGGGGNK